MENKTGNKMDKLNSEILAGKSRELLNDQLHSIDMNNNKAGIFISISSLFIPLVFSLSGKFESSVIWIFIFYIPIVINLVGLYFLVKALFPKILYHGMNFNEFDRLIKENNNKIYCFEIGTNKDSYNGNISVVKSQNENLKRGLKIIFISIVVLALIIFINLIITKCT